MRWLTFILLACLSLCVQTTLAPSLAIGGAYPDFMLILLVHYALHAQAPSGLIAAWVLGLLTSLNTVETQGVVMLAYGLVGLAIWSVRDLTFTRHALTHFCITAACCLTVHFALRSYYHLAGGGHDSLAIMLWASLCSAVYTGLWAVPVHHLMMRCSRALGLRKTGKALWTDPLAARSMRVV